MFLLLDDLCVKGYTYSFYFRIQAAPKSWIEKYLSPLHARVMILLQHIPFDMKKFVCSMSNLYISPKFRKVTLNERGKIFMIHRVCRPSRGIPRCIVQDDVTKKDDILRSKNTVKSLYFIYNTCKKVDV